MYQEVFEIWKHETKAIAPFMAQQQLLAEEQQALSLMCLLARWENPEDDDALYSTLQLIEDRVNTASKRRGVYQHFKYANYASQFQDLFEGYGEVNRQRLLAISKEYNLEGVFQNLANTGYKLTKPFGRYSPIGGHFRSYL
ncbi:FAD binding domain containing protein [Fusarium agapanthi]|uniref:FAD binding domain containing protein n=1 Tax=Fusarium agapanthi TaxID=1803897 RepID=A0A9P5BA61_9HYPO|nr:FAD binding domain containing protein [Fusarium agapanthi]